MRTCCPQEAVEGLAVVVVAAVDTRGIQMGFVAVTGADAAKEEAPNAERSVVAVAAVVATAEPAHVVGTPLHVGVFARLLVAQPFGAVLLRPNAVVAILPVVVGILLVHVGDFPPVVDVAALLVVVPRGVSFLPLHAFDVRVPNVGVLPRRVVCVAPPVATERAPP